MTPADAVGALCEPNGRWWPETPTSCRRPVSSLRRQAGVKTTRMWSRGALSLRWHREHGVDLGRHGSPAAPAEGYATLGWHYRSQDERLITFSNAQPYLYDWSLTTFPGVAGDGLPAPCPGAVPARAGPARRTRSPTKCCEVVELVAEHARSRPDAVAGRHRHGHQARQPHRGSSAPSPKLTTTSSTHFIAGECIDAGAQGALLRQEPRTGPR